MTSAPESASSRVQYGPAIIALKSSTRIPCSGPVDFASVVLIALLCLFFGQRGPAQRNSAYRDLDAVDLSALFVDEPQQMASRRRPPQHRLFGRIRGRADHHARTRAWPDHLH